MATFLGIDYGHKKLGLAVGQSITETAQPLMVVPVNGAMWAKIDTVFSQWRPQGVVVGQPKLADGKTHPLEKAIEAFINELILRYNTVVYREDESLTTVEAGDYVQAGRQQLLDAHAAALFLQSWLRTNPSVSP